MTLTTGDLLGAGALLAAVLLTFALVRLVFALVDFLDRHDKDRRDGP